MIAASTAATPTSAPANAQEAKTISQILGEITWLLSQCDKWKELRLSDLERLVMPAIILKQFKIEYVEQTPVAVVLWARSADENIRARILESVQSDIRLWSGGEEQRPVLTASLLENHRRI